MVRKSLIKVLLVCVLAVTMVQPFTASAYSIYTDGNISTTYVTYFRDISNKIPSGSDYVFFRAGQNEYVMVVGNLKLSSGKITSTGSVKVYSIYTSGNYNSTYNYSETTESSFSLSVGSSLIYSNLGNYPNLIERNDVYAFSALILLGVGVGCYLLRSVFSFSLRSRHGNNGDKHS